MKQYPIEYNNEILWAKFIGLYKPTGLLALQINDSEGLPYMTASVNVVDEINDIHLFPESKQNDSKKLVIKNYSENTGIEDSLLKSGIITHDDQVGIAQVGHAHCSVYAIKEELWKS